MKPNQISQSQSNKTSSVSDFVSEDSIQQQQNMRSIALKNDENIQRIIQLGMEEKVNRNVLGRIDVGDAVQKVSQNTQQLSIKEGASFVLAVTKLIAQGYTVLNNELKEFFTRFQDHIMKQQQQKKQSSKDNSRKNNQKKKLQDTARELAESLSSHGSIDERSNTSIQQPRHISSEERLNLQERNLVSPLNADGTKPARGSENDSQPPSEDSNGFGDKRLQMIGQEETGLGAYVGDLGDNGFDYQFSDHDSQGTNSQGFDAVRIDKNDIQGELNKAGEEFRERQVLRILRGNNNNNYNNQQSASKQKKKRPKGEEVKVEGDKELQVEQMRQNMQTIIDKFFEEGVAGSCNLHQDNSQEKSSISEDYKQFKLNIDREDNGPLSLKSILAETIRLDDTAFDQSFAKDILQYEDSPIESGLEGEFYGDASTLLPSGNFLKNLEKTLLDSSSKGMSDFIKELKGEQEPDGKDDIERGNEDQYNYASYDGMNYNYDNNVEEQIPSTNDNIPLKAEEEVNKDGLTNEDHSKISKYNIFITQLSQAIGKSKTTSFSNLINTFKAQKSKAELFYDLLELKKLGQLDLNQRDPLKFSPIQVDLI